MTTAAFAPNPFALMMDPEAVREMIDKSEQLSKLSQRHWRRIETIRDVS